MKDATGGDLPTNRYFVRDQMIVRFGSKVFRSGEEVFLTGPDAAARTHQIESPEQRASRIAKPEQKEETKAQSPEEMAPKDGERTLDKIPEAQAEKPASGGKGKGKK